MGAEPVKELVIAKWEDRFVAWLIDFIVVGAITEAIFAAFSLPFAFSLRAFDFADFMKLATDYLQIRSVIYLLYWTYFESTSGQSLGKKVMNLKVVDMNGNVPNTTMAFFASSGQILHLGFRCPDRMDISKREEAETAQQDVRHW